MSSPSAPKALRSAGPRLSRSGSPLVALALALAALSREAAADPIANTRASFVDSGRRVEVLRRGPALSVADQHMVAAAPNLGGKWSRVELTYPGNAPIAALVDETAIVTLEPGTDPEAALEGMGVELVRPLMPGAGLYLVRDATGGDGVDASARLAEARGVGLARGVRQAMPNLYVRMKTTAEFTPNDPRLNGQWYFDNLHMKEAWGLSKGAASETIVIVDTGCDLTHPDLVAKMDPGRDVLDDDDDPSPDLAEQGTAHGTECAGIAAAVTDNGEGIAGGCPLCRLRCVRLIDASAQPISTNVEAFQFALDTNASVVSNSWGFIDKFPVPEPLADAINLVFDTGRSGKGAIVVFAMGNDSNEVGSDELQGVRGVLGVGAITNLDQTTSFTNFGAPVDVVAPTGTLTTDISGPAGSDPGDYSTSFGGTSSACPVVAGIMGLLAAAAPNKTSQELYDIVIQTARPAPYAEPDENGHDPLYGYGVIDPVKALKVALGLPTGEGGAGGSGGAGAGQNDDGCSCNLTSEDEDRLPPALPLAGLALYALGRRLRRARATR